MLVMANKLKVVDKFGAIKAMLNGEPVENFSVADAVAFLDERIAITEKKNANGGGERKPTKEQIANEGVKDTIKAVLAEIGVPSTITDLQKASAELGGFSNQKISALLTQLVKGGAVVRTEVKGKAHFALAE
jgi:ribulose 1,5-bisphosphate synthetase/thiazole synthase